jgi:hypothetical protein
MYVDLENTILVLKIEIFRTKNLLLGTDFVIQKNQLTIDFGVSRNAENNLVFRRILEIAYCPSHSQKQNQITFKRKEFGT